MKRRNLILLGAGSLVIAGVAALVVVSDKYPPEENLTGAIGGVEKAERYRDAQLAKDDVPLVYDEEGYDQFGYDKDGFDRNGLDKNGIKKGIDKFDLGIDKGVDKGIDKGVGFDKGVDKGVGFDKGVAAQDN